MDAARLRRTFRYVGDDDGPSDEPEVLDEQEQDALIEMLVAQNQHRNEQFRQALLAVPLLAMVPFLVACFSPSGPARSAVVVMLPLLGLTSLAATTYLLYRQPATVTGLAALDAWSGHVDKGKGVLTRTSPLDRHLPLLNVGLGAVLLLSLCLPSSASGSAASYRLLGSLPAAVYALVLVAKVTMAGVDPERDLGDLRYEYKGA